jgi:hypothetical protein
MNEPEFTQKLALFDFLVAQGEVGSESSVSNGDKENDRKSVHPIADADLQVSLDLYAEKLRRGLVRSNLLIFSLLLTLFFSFFFTNKSRQRNMLME